jgi:hypothetical protein
MYENQFYCVACRKKVRCTKQQISVKRDRRGRPRLVGWCCESHTRLYKYIPFDKEKELKKKYA